MLPADLHQVPSSAWRYSAAPRCRIAMCLIKCRSAASRSVLKARGDFIFWSQNGSVPAVTGLRAWHLSSIAGTDKIFSICHHVQTCPGTHIASCAVDTGDLSPVGRAVGVLS